jgi:hypothetical protein
MTVLGWWLRCAVARPGVRHRRPGLRDRRGAARRAFDAERLGVEPGRVSRTRAGDCVRPILGAATTGLFLALRPRFCVSLRGSPGVDDGLLTLIRRGVRPTPVLGQVVGALAQLIERLPRVRVRDGLAAVRVLARLCPCLLQLTLRRELIVSAQRTGNFFRLARHRVKQSLAGFCGLITTHNVLPEVGCTGSSRPESPVPGAPRSNSAGARR